MVLYVHMTTVEGAGAETSQPEEVVDEAAVRVLRALFDAVVPNPWELAENVEYDAARD